MNDRLRRLIAVSVALLMVTSIPVAYVAIDAPGSDNIKSPIDTAEAKTYHADGIYEGGENGTTGAHYSVYNSGGGTISYSTTDSTEGSHSLRIHHDAGNGYSETTYQSVVESESNGDFSFDFRVNTFSDGNPDYEGYIDIQYEVLLTNGTTKIVEYRLATVDATPTSDPANLFFVVNGHNSTSWVSVSRNIESDLESAGISEGIDKIITYRTHSNVPGTGGGTDKIGVLVDNFHLDSSYELSSSDSFSDTFSDFEDGTAGNWGQLPTKLQSDAYRGTGSVISTTPTHGIYGNHSYQIDDGASDQYGAYRSIESTDTIAFAVQPERLDSDSRIYLLNETNETVSLIQKGETGTNFTVHADSTTTDIANAFKYRPANIYLTNIGGGNYDVGVGGIGVVATDLNFSADGPITGVAMMEDTDVGRSRWDEWSYGYAGVGGGDITGTVVNQHGNPVGNATVEAWGYAAPTYAQSKEELSTLSDPIPSEFTDQLNSGFQLEGATGYFADRENAYAAVFSTGDWPAGITFDDPDLTPKWRQITPGEEIVLTSWDPTSPRTGGIDEELAGQTTDNPVVIEQLDGTGDVVEDGKETYNLTSEYSTADFTWPPTKTHSYTKTTLDTGIYRIYAQGNAEAAYYIKVGDPKPTLDDTLEAIDGALSDQAQAIEDKLSTGDLIRTKATTDENGTFSLDIDSSVKGVQVQAYKKPDELTSVDAQSLSLADLREFSATDYNGSFVLPSDIKRVDPPETGVEISVVEAKSPTYSGLGEFENLSAWLNDQLTNLSYEDLGDTIQQRLEDLNREELENLNQDLETLVNQNEKLRSQLNETTVNESDLSDDELRDRIGELEGTIDGLRNTIEEGEEEFSRGEESITWRKQFETELEDDDVLVLVHYTNGTTDTLTTDSEYISVDSQLGQGDSVVVEELPLGDAAGAALEVVVANEDGTGSATRQVQNPTFDGEVPGLSSISLTSLHPGASETVSMQLNPAEESTIADVSAATVYAPDGSTISPTIDGTKATFQTNGAGVYDIRATFVDTEGNEYEYSQKVRAGETDLDLPPGIRGEETPYGTVAIVGDGLEDGSVEVRDGGSEVRLVGQIAEDAEAPQRVDANTETLSLLANHKTTVSVVRGEDEQGVAKNVRVVLKEPGLDTDSQGLTNFPPLVYRNGEPLPRGESSDGIVDLNESTARIETYTDTTGSVEIRTIENPSVTQWFRYQADSFKIPSIADLLSTVIVAP